MSDSVGTNTLKYFYGWIGMGPTAVHNTIMDYGWCKRSWWPLPVNRQSCRVGLNVLPSPSFAPIPAPLVGDLLLRDQQEMGEKVKWLMRNSYGVHLNNQHLKSSRLSLIDNSVIAGLFRKYCPVTARLSGGEL